MAEYGADKELASTIICLLIMTAEIRRFCGSRYSNRPDLEKVDFRNNVIYNWGSNNIYTEVGDNIVYTLVTASTGARQE